MKWIENIFLRKAADNINKSKVLCSFLETIIFQSLDAKEVAITYIHHDCAVDCSIEIDLEREIYSEYGVGIPFGFTIEEYYPKQGESNYKENLRFAKEFNKNNIRFVTDKVLNPNIPMEIRVPVSEIGNMSEKINVSFSFIFEGQGGGVIPGNVIIGLKDESALREQERYWNLKKENWLKYRNPN